MAGAQNASSCAWFGERYEAIRHETCGDLHNSLEQV
jgi:hypothetical protein